MKRLSKWFYLGSTVGVPFIGIVLIVIALAFLVLSGILYNLSVTLSDIDIGVGFACSLLILLGCAAVLYGVGIWYVLLYKAWEVIQDNNASATPGKAVGFLFIPAYNFYWIFRVWWGFARDYNRYVARYSLKAPKMKEGLFLAFCILSICSSVLSLPVTFIANTYLSYPAAVLSLIIFALTANQTIDGVNALLTR